MYVKQSIPGVGEVVTWIPLPVVDAMLQFLVDKTGKRLENMTKRQRELLFGQSKKERRKNVK